MVEFIKMTIFTLKAKPLRSVLTALGVAIALFAFCMIQSLLKTWVSGVENSSTNKLIIRNAVSLMQPLPIAYENTIRSIPGVLQLTYGQWFGGKFRGDEKRPSPQFAVGRDYFKVYSDEYILKPQDLSAWQSDRKGVITGPEIVSNYDLKIGSVAQLQSREYADPWDFTIRAIYTPADSGVDENQTFFHWEYWNEKNIAAETDRANKVSFYAVLLHPKADSAEVAALIDSKFANSYAETKTETESAMVQGFISMSSAILLALEIVSWIVIGIMLLVLANTMLMSFRERYREFTVLKCLGFQVEDLIVLVFGEAAILSLSGFVVFCILISPFVFFSKQIFSNMDRMLRMLERFHVHGTTFLWVIFLTFLIAFVASLVPILELKRIKLVEGIRRLG